MFDLEQAITKWRQQMLAAGIKTPVPLEELESHLRDDVEQQIRTGLDARKAFRAGVKRLGQADPLTKEFAKEHSTRGLIIASLVIIPLAACYAVPMMWLNSHERDRTQRLLGLMAIIVTTLVIGSSPFVASFLFRAFPKERVRRIGRAGMIVATLGWLGVIACRIAMFGTHDAPSQYFSLSQIFVWLFILSNSIRMSAKDKPSRQMRELAG